MKLAHKIWLGLCFLMLAAGIIGLFLPETPVHAQQQNFSNTTTGSGSTVLATSPTLTTATLTGLTNGTGLQLFNTTTTCTTSTTISTPCTTSSISLPVGYSDSNYRVECTGLGVSNFPQIQTVTKSNTSFTITLNNLTAAAATYTSFDCMVGHN